MYSRVLALSQSCYFSTISVFWRPSLPHAGPEYRTLLVLLFFNLSCNRARHYRPALLVLLFFNYSECILSFTAGSVPLSLAIFQLRMIGRKNLGFTLSLAIFQHCNGRPVARAYSLSLAIFQQDYRASGGQRNTLLVLLFFNSHRYREQARTLLLVLLFFNPAQQSP